MTAIPLILASASPRRLDLLKQMGITPQKVVPASIDESPLKAESPSRYVIRVATLKADAVAAQYPGTFILAADTMVIHGGQMLGKAENPQDIQRYLTKLSGKSHHVFSGLCVIAPDGRMIQRAIQTRIRFKHLTSKEIREYAEQQEGIGKAGGYAIQGYAASFVTQMVGSYTNVVGLPLYETRNALIGLGYSI